MGMTSSLFLLLLLLVVPLRQITAAPIVFHHYVLALTWPNAFCMLEQSGPNPCQNPDQKDLQQFFTIHGFWPTFVNHTSVPRSSCTASAFVLSNLNKTVSSLADMYWPNVRKSKGRKVLPGESAGFWKHEWDYHGICSNLQQGDYMFLTLAVYNQVQQPFIDLVNIYRNTSKTVDINKFQQQLTTLLGGNSTPMLVCGNLKNSTDQYLREIRIRVSFPYSIIPDKTILCDTSKPVYFLTFP